MYHERRRAADENQKYVYAEHHRIFEQKIKNHGNDGINNNIPKQHFYDRRKIFYGFFRKNFFPFYVAGNEPKNYKRNKKRDSRYKKRGELSVKQIRRLVEASEPYHDE